MENCGLNFYQKLKDKLGQIRNFYFCSSIMEVKGYSGGNGSNCYQRQIKALQYRGNLYRWMFTKIREGNVEGFVFLPPHHPKRIFPLSRDTITVQSRANADLKRAITDDIQCIFLTIEIIQQKLGNVKMPFLS